MSAWTVQIDPVAIAPDRTVLDLNSGPITIGSDSGGGTGIDWGTADLTAYLTQQGQFGNSAVDWILPNRTVTINLVLGGTNEEENEETARSQLQQKVALLQREGGQLLRQRFGGPAMYADIVYATLVIPDEWGETGEIEPDVQLVLTTLPDFYGAEITLDTITGSVATADSVLKLSGTQAVIEGDYPARCRIIVKETDGDNDQKGLLWGFRSRYYSSATTAALTYSATAMTPLNGATEPVSEDFQETLAITDVPGLTWMSFMSTTLSSGSAALTHQGSYRVWARVYASTVQCQLRLLWGSGGLATPVVNDAVTVPNTGDWYLVDLGVIRNDAPPVGPCEWFGALQIYYSQTGTVSSTLAVHELHFQPLDESAGTLSWNSNSEQASAILAGPFGPDAASDSNPYSEPLAWTNPSYAEDNDENGASAIASGSSTQNTHQLNVSDFDFTVPSGATIQGIQVDINRGEIYPVGAYGSVVDSNVYLVKGGTIQTTENKAKTGVPWGPISFVTYGGPTDMWGISLAPSDVNASNFGVSMAAQPGYGNGAAVYYIQVTVYYVLASGFTIAEDAVVYKSQTAELRTDGMYRTDPTGSVYGPESIVTGDLPRLPPSGIENRPVELLVRSSIGDMDSLADSTLNAISAQVVYRPCWLSRP